MNNVKLNLLIERLVKEEIRKSLLREATLNLDEDVDYIFEKGFSKFFKKLLAGQRPNIRDVKAVKDVEFAVLDSSELPSEESKRAHAVNPVTIHCGLWFSKRSKGLYEPFAKKIYISVQTSAISALYKGFTSKDIEPDQQQSFKSETESATSTKSTIYHELSHWIRDSLSNKHIEKILGRASAAGIKNPNASLNIKNLGLPDTYMTNYEIDALIHNIKQFKRDMSEDEWNSLTFLDLIRMIPSINKVFNRLRTNWIEFYASSAGKNKPSWSRNWAKEFVKMLIKRMSRENLLGNNMRKMNYNNWRY